MVVKRVRAHLKCDVVHHGAIIGPIREHSVESSEGVRVVHSRVVAKVIKEDLYLDVRCIATLNPAWVCAKDRYTVSRCEGGNTSREYCL